MGDLDGITTFCELAVPLASRLAEALGLPHNSVQAVDNARDKVTSRGDTGGAPYAEQLRQTFPCPVRTLYPPFPQTSPILPLLCSMPRVRS